jgi:hypothetical protein
MRRLLTIALCGLLAGSGMAQRRGGGGFNRGGGGASRGGGFAGGGFGRGGFAGGAFGHGDFRGSRSFGFRGFYGASWPYAYAYYPWYDFGYWPSYYSYYDPYTYDRYPGTYSYAAYNTSPNVTVIYPAQAQSAPNVVHTQPANSLFREYDEYGQEVTRAPTSSGNAAASPIYLIAFRNHEIRAAAAYWVDGKTVRYITLQHEEKQAPLDTIDRDFSLQLNRERRVQFQLPMQ